MLQKQVLQPEISPSITFFFLIFIQFMHTFLNLCFKQTFYGELQKSLTEGKLTVETWQRMFTVLLWQCFDIKNQNGNTLVKVMRSLLLATL